MEQNVSELRVIMMTIYGLQQLGLQHTIHTMLFNHLSDGDWRLH